ncbi:MAG: hypothetical protein HYZ51_04105 [Candidatus Doudnabacteria bacterium]|nr:hypothetical protein [Candidatus Doudnabacteria bacterium]
MLQLAYFPNPVQIFHLAFLFITEYYGWVAFLLGLAYMLWHLYLEEIQGQFVRGIDWVFLEITPPKENLVSTLAVESIFAQMHALHRSLTFAEKYVEGQFQQWYSLEIVSFGGKVCFIIKAPRRYWHLVESAFYSQYPSAEIREIDDYMENFKYDPQDPDNQNEIFGVEFKLTEDSVIPLKTYKDFEHTAAEETVVDPLSNLFETLQRLEPWEFIGLQLLVQVIQNDEIKGRVEKKVKELIGQEFPHKASFSEFFLKPVSAFSKLSYKEALIGEKHSRMEENKPRTNWLNMTEGEKERVTLIEKKFGKPNYNCKLRLLYITPKEKYDKIRRFEVIGVYRHFSSGFYNTMKTDRQTWTKVDPLFSQKLEQPVLDWITNYRKRWFVKGYKARSIYIGSSKFLLSTEEIASLYHFPITTKTSFVPSGVLAVATKKVQPPADLPILEQ